MRDGSDFARAERLGRERLSKRFFLRDFLYSETAAAYGLANLPDDETLAIRAGRGLCENLLEPLADKFGRIHIRSAFRSCAVNAKGNVEKRNCANNESNFADHIWDRMDGERFGATACIVIPAFYDAFPTEGDWTQLAWWIHDHLPYNSMCFFGPKTRWAFNLNWSDGVEPEKRIDSWAARFENGTKVTSRLLTKPGMANHTGSHASEYRELLSRFG